MSFTFRTSRACSLIALIALLASFSFAQNKVSRISGAIDDAHIARIRGNVNPLTRAAQDLGPVDDSFTIGHATLYFQRSAQQQDSLDKLLAEQQDPASPNFHQWLTPAQFGDRFGLSTADYAKVSVWLTSRGFRIVDTPHSRNFIAFSGTAQQISSVFRTPIHQFSINGEKHFANASEPAIPAALSGIVQSVGSLHDFRPRPRVTARHINPNFTSSTSGNHFVAPDDFATIYNLKSLYNNGNDGTGVTIAVMGQTNINISDTTTFRSLSGLPVNDPTKFLVPGLTDPGTVTADLFEATLDVQWSGAVAPKASILYVYSNNVLDAFQYTITHTINGIVPPVISISYGDCEAHWSTQDAGTMNSLAQQASAQGQTIVSASGDSGAADCDYQVTVAANGLAVDIPAALPNVTGMGGTTFNESSGTFWNSTNNTNNGSAISYIPEDAWNDTAFELAQIPIGDISASGGGKSTLFSKPSWQTGTGVPADGVRDVPDVSLASSADHDGYLTCLAPFCINGYRDSGGFLKVAGGTSVAAPAFAGIVALINQKTGTRQGNINPTLYSLAATAPNSFHDITTGDNKVPCLSGTTNCPSGTTTIGYSATLGYDTVTGLGTVNASNLITQWPGAVTTPDFTGSATAPSMTLTRITTSTTGTQNITFTAQNGFTGTINLTCSVSTSLTGVTCGLNPTSLTNSGTTVLTVTIPAKSAASGATFARLTLPIAFGFFFIGGLGLTRKSRVTVTIALALLLTLTFVGCGGGGSSSSNPSGGGTGTSTPLTGTITVQATSGAITHNVPISVTVN